MAGLKQAAQRLVKWVAARRSLHGISLGNSGGFIHPTEERRAKWLAVFFSLPIEPVREFHQEPVVGPQIEQVVHVATEAARPLDPRGPLATLTPHDEQGRPRPVLPAEHDIRAELLEVEAGSGGGSCRRRGGGASGDWLASVTAARSGHPRSMKSPGWFPRWMTEP